MFGLRRTGQAGNGNGSLDIKGYVVTLQKDGRLLLRHLARRSDCALPEGAPTGATYDGSPSKVLFADPEGISRNHRDIAELVGCVDVLSRRASPANVRSIRLTSAYLHMSAENGEPPEEIKREASRVYLAMSCVTGLALVLFVGSVFLLSHADYGQRMLRQLDDLYKKREVLNNDILSLSLLPKDKNVEGHAAGKKNVPLGGVGNGAQLCDPRRENAGWLEPMSPKAAALCERQKDLGLRLTLTYAALSEWNCLTTRLLNPWHLLNPQICEQLPSGLPSPKDDLRAWQSHETRTQSMIGVAGGFVLPMMLACLGGCAYVLRRLDEKLRTWTLEPNDGVRAVVRVALAGVLGGLVGVIWTSDQPVSLGGYTLSLAAVAFFIGFSVEAVFKLIERLTSTVIGGLDTQPAGAAPAMLPTFSSISLIRPAQNDDSLQKPSEQATIPAESPARQTRLAEIQRQLTDQRESLSALARLGTGSPVTTDAPKVIDGIDQTLRIIQPLVTGAPDAANLDATVKQAETALEDAENAGLPGILADAAATLKGTLAFAGPVIGGIAGGPVGIIGGIVLGGLKLYENQQAFQAMKAALLKKPFDPAMRLSAPDRTTALAALDASPLMSARIPREMLTPGFAIKLMQTLLMRNGNMLIPVQDLVADLKGPDRAGLKIGPFFESAEELARAIDEFRGSGVFADALERFGGSVDVPAPDGGPPQTIDLKELAKTVSKLREDPRAASAIDRVVALTEGLAGLPKGPLAVADLVVTALTKVPDIVAKSRA